MVDLQPLIVLTKIKNAKKLEILGRLTSGAIHVLELYLVPFIVADGSIFRYLQCRTFLLCYVSIGFAAFFM